MQEEKEQRRPKKGRKAKDNEKATEKSLKEFRPITLVKHYPPETHFRGSVIVKSAARPPVKSDPIVEPLVQLSKQETCDRILSLLLKKFYGDQTRSSVLPGNNWYYFQQLSTGEIDSQFPKVHSVINVPIEERTFKLKESYEASKRNKEDSTPEEKESEVEGKRKETVKHGVSKQDATPEVNQSTEIHNTPMESVEEELERLFPGIVTTNTHSDDRIVLSEKMEYDDLLAVLSDDISPSTLTDTERQALIGESFPAENILTVSKRKIGKQLCPSKRPLLPENIELMSKHQQHTLEESSKLQLKRYRTALGDNVPSEPRPKWNIPVLEESPGDTTTSQPRPNWHMPIREKSLCSASMAKWHISVLKNSPCPSTSSQPRQSPVSKPMPNLPITPGDAPSGTRANRHTSFLKESPDDATLSKPMANCQQSILGKLLVEATPLEAIPNWHMSIVEKSPSKPKPNRHISILENVVRTGKVPKSTPNWHVSILKKSPCAAKAIKPKSRWQASILKELPCAATSSVPRPADSRPSELKPNGHTPIIEKSPGESTPPGPRPNSRLPTLENLSGHDTPSESRPSQHMPLQNSPGGGTPPGPGPNYHMPTLDDLSGHDTSSESRPSQHKSLQNSSGGGTPLGPKPNYNMLTFKNLSDPDIPSDTPPSQLMPPGPGPNYHNMLILEKLPNRYTPSESRLSQHMPLQNSSHAGTGPRPNCHIPILKNLPGRVTPSQSRPSQHMPLQNSPRGGTLIGPRPSCHMPTLENLSVHDTPSESRLSQHMLLQNTPRGTTPIEQRLNYHMPSLENLSGHSTPSESKTSQNMPMQNSPRGCTPTDQRANYHMPTLENLSGHDTPSESRPSLHMPLQNSPGGGTPPGPRPNCHIPILENLPGRDTPSESRPNQHMPMQRSVKYNITDSELTDADIVSSQSSQIICCPSFKCNEIFRDIETFVTHLYTHGNIGICVKCWKVFPNDRMLKSHSITHMNYKLIPCQFEYCGKQFKDVSDLRTHMKVHFTNKPYICPKCHQSFGEKDEIARHIAGHTAKIILL